MVKVVCHTGELAIEDSAHRRVGWAIIGIGCTKATGSRPAIEALAHAAPSVGISCDFLPSRTVFSFANSAQSVVREKCRIWFPTSPPCSPDIDICEEGHVPVLFSLPQMRMLSLTIEPTPEGVFLTCPSFGYVKKPARMATSQHVVLNLADDGKRSPALDVAGWGRRLF